ncbi:tail fiber protein [Bradyrhizobium sp. BWC-3-1]|uniref:tail fiber protein n=1 Tax=Bradyrhizobium sp. BWC-3-1 TaxID=3080012 RepID=UPI00293F07E2|nr:tail fiber protein [Bradyrhizobium sp. BWC-3-1]WOH58530.1 tail fiber protein [Bradyrhizobium sp. BWC-3-1]
MPSANGVYSLPSGYLAVTGTTIQASQHNPPLEDIAAALTARLSRDGTAAMTGPIQFTPGVVGLPGAVFSTDLTTGFYKTTNGIGVAVGGVKVGEFLAGGIIGARVIGELVPYVCTTAPSSLWVLPFGQTLSRTTYAALWTQAQIEIAAGNTFFNNGDGSTTFGIGDLRGRVVAGKDNMGGSAAGRLTGSGNAFGAQGGDPTILGATGGAQSSTLLTANLPPYTPSGTITNGAITFSNMQVTSQATGASQGFTTGPSQANADMTNRSGVAQATTTFTGTAQGGTSAAFPNVQPTIITNYILFAGGQA